MTAESERLNKLQQKLEATKKQIRAEEKRLRESERRRETKRKVIAGALALKHAEQDGAFKATLYRLLDEYVERDDDRALFGLEAKQEPGAQKQAAE